MCDGPSRKLCSYDGVGDRYDALRDDAVGPPLEPGTRPVPDEGRNRPFTMKRYPYGVAGDVYFRKQVPKGMACWIPTRAYRTHPREGGSRLVDFPHITPPEALLWMVRMNCSR